MSSAKHVPPPDLRCDQAVVRIEAGKNRYHDGVLSEVSDSGLAIDFPLSGAPNLWVGQEIQMNVAGPRLGSSVQAVGRVRLRIEDGARCRYRFESGADDLGALRLLVERRGLQRVEPYEELWVRICNPEGESLAVGRVRDLSRAGMRVFVGLQDREQVAHLRACLLVLQFPGDTTATQLFAEVRSEAKSAEGVALGFEYIAGPASPFVSTLERIERFVADSVVEQFEQLASQVRGR